MSWLSSKKRPVQRTRPVPDGACLIDEDGNKFYVTGGRVLPVASDDVFKSWSFPVVFHVPRLVIDTYPKGGRLGFRPGTVRRSLAGGDFWYFASGQRHKIVGTDFFKESGIAVDSVRWASREDVELHKEGSEIL